jgi:adenylate cyclase
MRLNPQYPFYYLWTLGHSYYLTGRNAEATSTFTTLIERNPNFLPAHVFLAILYMDRGLEQQARVEWAAVARLHPHVSLESLRRMLPYRDERDLDRLLAAMRKVGLG